MGDVLIFGASGQLGQCLKAVSERREFTRIVTPDEANANILDISALDALFQTYQPKYVINCAAYTAVDKADTVIDTARKVNKDGPANLAKLCAEYNSTLIHISTDFVFSGDATGLLTEDAEAKPVSVYGLTKLEGEQAIATATAKYFILRTSWLYSEFGNNFVKTMLRFGKERDEMRIIADQMGTPTYGIDLAGVILDIILSDSEAYGIYHYSNEGAASWYDFAKSIFDLAGLKLKILPILTVEYPTPAVRPKFSVMDKSKIKKTFNISIPYWRDSLQTCINILEQ